MVSIGSLLCIAHCDYLANMSVAVQVRINNDKECCMLLCTQHGACVQGLIPQLMVISLSVLHPTLPARLCKVRATQGRVMCMLSLAHHHFSFDRDPQCTALAEKDAARAAASAPGIDAGSNRSGGLGSNATICAACLYIFLWC